MIKKLLPSHQIYSMCFCTHILHFLSHYITWTVSSFIKGQFYFSAVISLLAYLENFVPSILCLELSVSLSTRSLSPIKCCFISYSKKTKQNSPLTFHLPHFFTSKELPVFGVSFSSSILCWSHSNQAGFIPLL